ncbi:hypothetical protein MLD38_005989 [Melastoma candidum]|nr:hypothetical protein MLD38_005989 [Melastoma candidum]
MLDYFDRVKIDGISGTSILATLFQASGLAQEMQGFLNITRSVKGNVVFRSTMEGGSPDAEFVKAVAAQPYNISVLQISRLIIAPGINMTNPSAASPSPSKAPVVTTSPAEAPLAESPTEDDPFFAPSGSPVDAPADAPFANAPTADPPLPDAPVESMDHQASLSVGIAIVMGLIWLTT